MKRFSAFPDAAVGWLDLIARRPGAAEKFDATTGGVITAIAYYFLVIGILILLDLAVPGRLTFDRLVTALVLNALPVLGVLLVVWLTVRLLRPAGGFAALAVPAVFALVFRVLLGVPLNLVFGSLVEYTLGGVLLYMLYRLAHDIGKMSVGISIAFAALSIVALVGLPHALYMLMLPAATAT